MAARQRIALISSSYHPHTGGVEEHVRHLARELARRGHVVAIWTVDRGERLGMRHVDGIDVRYLPTPMPARSMSSLLSFLARLPLAVVAWARAYRSLRPSLLNVQCFGPNGVYGWGVSRLTRTPLVVSSHGETMADDHDAFGQSALLRAALSHALRDASAVTGCSCMVLEDLAGRFGLSSGIVVPNGIDLGEASEQVRPKTWPKTGPVVLGLGRVEYNKGFDLLIRSFAQLLGETSVPSPPQLVIAGDGSAKGALKRLVTQLGVGESVTFTGRLDRSEVAGAIAAADVLVVPSRIEAFGLVALEAWRGAAPLVMTSRGGAKDFVTHEQDALVVDPEDTSSVAQAMRRLLTDAALARSLAQRGRERVADFTWERVVDRYEQVYDVVSPPDRGGPRHSAMGEREKG